VGTVAACNFASLLWGNPAQQSRPASHARRDHQVKAIAAALRVITAEIRLFQLDDVAKRTTRGPTTVVQPDLAQID